MVHLLESVLAGFIAFTPATLAGALAVVAGCLWPLLGSRRRILAVQVLSSVLFGLHYTLLGAHTAAAMCLAGALQGVAARSGFVDTAEPSLGRPLQAPGQSAHCGGLVRDPPLQRVFGTRGEQGNGEVLLVHIQPDERASLPQRPAPFFVCGSGTARP